MRYREVKSGKRHDGERGMGRNVAEEAGDLAITSL